jgi:hypothetical protein
MEPKKSVSARVGLSAVAIALVAGCATVVGCSSTPAGPGGRPSVDQLSEGINVFSNDATRVEGAFKQGTHAVYFETRQGAPILDMYKQAMPDQVGDHEIDARILDEQGHVLVIQRGGDNFVDPTWDRDLGVQHGQPVTTSTATMRLAAQAADALIATTSPPREHRLALTGLAGAVGARAQDILESKGGKIHAMATNAECTLDDPNGWGNTSDESCTWGLGTSNYKIHYQCIIDIFTCEGDHSSMEIDDGAYTLYSCNHGACAYSMGSVSCQASGLTGGCFQAEGSGSTGQVQGGCQTPYNWNSGGGTHNCHDDSTLQGWGARYGCQNTGGGKGLVCNGQNWWLAPGVGGHPCP